MFEALIDGAPEVGIKHQDFVKQVDCLLPSPGIHRAEIDTVRFGECVEVLEGLLVSNITLIFFVGRADHLEDDCQLVVLREGET